MKRTTVDKLRVLVIDDSSTIRAIVSRLIEQEAGCSVVGVAGDVPTALQLLAGRYHNVITLDLAMPGIDGLRFLDELRDQLHAPIVVVSSSTREGSSCAAEALAMGAEACFDKTKLISDAPRFMRLLKKAANRQRTVQRLRA